MTYPLDVTVRNPQAVKVFEPLRYAKQLPIGCEESDVSKHLWLSRQQEFTHQRRPGRVRMRGRVLDNVPVLPPIIHQGKLEERRVDAAER